MICAADFPGRCLPPLVFAYGFSLRKRAIVRRFLAGTQIRFVGHPGRVPAESVLLLWGATPAPAGLPEGARVLRLEDGFLRSVGLGADLVQPLSWVADSRGIYFDPSGPSDLELILQTADFPSGLLERAARLRANIVENGLTKYNVGTRGWAPRACAGRKILVPGQVETDASVRLGAPGINTNLGLIKAVREANPGAYLIYKPHPDIAAGLRPGGKGEDGARRWCDETVSDFSIGEIIQAVDEVHVMTSLAGFEALLRCKKVVCYGQPFYAGWQLTTDMARIPRRTRRLELDELVAGALILYPRYVSRITGRPTTPEGALSELLEWRSKYTVRFPRVLQVKRRVLQKIEGWRGGS